MTLTRVSHSDRILLNNQSFRAIEHELESGGDLVGRFILFLVLCHEISCQLLVENSGVTFCRTENVHIVFFLLQPSTSRCNVGWRTFKNGILHVVKFFSGSFNLHETPRKAPPTFVQSNLLQTTKAKPNKQVIPHPSPLLCRQIS